MASRLRGGALDVKHTPLPNSISTRTGIKEMPEPKAILQPYASPQLDWGDV